MTMKKYHFKSGKYFILLTRFSVLNSAQLRNILKMLRGTRGVRKYQRGGEKKKRLKNLVSSDDPSRKH